jgi:hypothetical protein
MTLWPSDDVFFSVSTATSTSPISSAPSLSSFSRRQRSLSQSASFVKLDVVQNWLNQAQARHERFNLVTFMPDKNRDPTLTTVNQGNFRNLSRILWDKQAVSISSSLPCVPNIQPFQVAVAPWRSTASGPNMPGGLLIYPSGNSTAILTGAVFVNTPFPDFVGGTQEHSPSPPSSAGVPPVPSMYRPQAPQLAITTTTSPYTSFVRSQTPGHSPYPQPYPYGNQRNQSPISAPPYTRSPPGDSPIATHSRSTMRAQSQPLTGPSTAHDLTSPVTPHQYQQSQMNVHSQFGYPQMNIPGSSTSFTAPTPITAPLPPAVNPAANTSWNGSKNTGNGSPSGMDTHGQYS